MNRIVLYNSVVKNATGKNKDPFADTLRLIRFSSLLWIGYLILLTVINQSFSPPNGITVETVYYMSLGVIALVCLALVYWKWIQQILGRFFIPIIIVIITALPIITTWIFFTSFPHSPILETQSSILQLLPFLVVGFLLIAWQYKWPYLLLIILAIAALNIAMLWSFPTNNNLGPFPGIDGSGPFPRAFNVPLIQTIVFLAVGFAINYLISRLRRQQQSLENANINLTHYASTLEELATTRERSRLARELHDTLAHTLSGMAVQLEAIKACWDLDPKTARELLEKSLSTAHSGLEETRRSLQALRASPLEDMGLVKAIKNLAETLAQQKGLVLRLTVTDKILNLSPDVEQAVYRIAQEAITNIINHADAKMLEIKIDFIGNRLSLFIRDDGVGFDVDKVFTSTKFGLIGMRERAVLIGGKLTIESKPNQGTTIRLTV